MAGRPTEPTHPTPSVWTDLALEDDVRIPLPGGKGAMLFRRIPARDFLMGSRAKDADDEPRHRVVIDTEFWLGKYVVTQAEWEAVVRACTPVVERNGNSEELVPRPSSHDGDRRPVEQVSWDDCVAWCAAWQAFLDREPPPTWDPAWRIGLPSEAQWEYACRAGSETEYWNGDGEAALREIGWFAGNSGNRTHDVDEPVVPGSPERHPAGLAGMHGNVWEWCADAFDAGAYRKREDRWGAAKPWTDEDAAPQEYRFRVLRGGSWGYAAGDCRSAYRDWDWPGDRVGRQGFRVCLVRGPGIASSGGGAAAVGGEAEAEPAQQDKASETRPQSSAAGEAAAPAWEGVKLPPQPAAAQPRPRVI